MAALKPFQAFAVLPAEPTPVPFDVLTKMAKRITSELPEVSRVAYELTSNPMATIEYI